MSEIREGTTEPRNQKSSIALASASATATTAVAAADLDPRFTFVFVLLGLAIVVVELIGVFRKEAGDTITEHWRFAYRWLKNRVPMAGWAFMVFTMGLLIWLVGHLPGSWD